MIVMLVVPHYIFFLGYNENLLLRIKKKVHPMIYPLNIHRTITKSPKIYIYIYIYEICMKNKCNTK